MIPVTVPQKARPTAKSQSEPYPPRPKSKAMPNSSSSSTTVQPEVVNVSDSEDTTAPAPHPPHPPSQVAPTRSGARWHPPMAPITRDWALQMVGPYPSPDVKTTPRSSRFFDCECRDAVIQCSDCEKHVCSLCSFRQWNKCTICAYEQIFPLSPETGRRKQTFQQFCHDQAVYEFYRTVLKPMLDQ